MPGERYFEARDRLLDCCHRIELLAEASGVAVREDPEGTWARLATPLRIVALGEVNAGKSTLLNALAGVELCPAGPLPTTRETSWWRHRSTRGGVPEGWVDERAEAGFLKRFELIDTPGSNSGWRDAVVANLPRFGQADLILVVFPSGNTWTAATWDLVSGLSDEALERTALVVQQADRKSAGDLEVIRGHMRDLCLKKVGRELPILPVAAQLALEAKLDPQNARKGWSASGFGAFEDFVEQQLCHSPLREHLLRRTAQEAGRRLREIEDGLDRQRRGMDDDGWFLTGLEREADALRDLVLNDSPKTLAGGRGRYEAEVDRFGRQLGRRLGVVPTMVHLFFGDSTPARAEADFAVRLQEAIRDFAEQDAVRLLGECEGHWGEVRPRVVERMAMDPGEATLTGTARERVIERFANRVGKAVTAALGQLRVRARLDVPLRRRTTRLRAQMALALVLLTAAGVCGALGWGRWASGLLAGAGALIVLLLASAWLSGRSVSREVRARLRDSSGQFESALKGDYAEAVRGLFVEYGNGLLGVRRQLAERKATLEPRAKRWDRLYLELKSIEQDL